MYNTLGFFAFSYIIFHLVKTQHYYAITWHEIVQCGLLRIEDMPMRIELMGMQIMFDIGKCTRLIDRKAFRPIGHTYVGMHRRHTKSHRKESEEAFMNHISMVIMAYHIICISFDWISTKFANKHIFIIYIFIQ